MLIRSIFYSTFFVLSRGLRKLFWTKCFLADERSDSPNEIGTGYDDCGDHDKSDEIVHEHFSCLYLLVVSDSDNDCDSDCDTPKTGCCKKHPKHIGAIRVKKVLYIVCHMGILISEFLRIACMTKRASICTNYVILLRLCVKTLI